MTLSFTSLSTSHVESIMPIEESCHSHPWSKKLLTGCIGGRYFGEIAMLDDEVIGFYIADKVADESTLMDICIKPSFQGQGLGKKLLQQYINEATTRECQTLWLEVRASNTAAQLLYINLGYSQTGRRVAYYPKEVGYEDALVMQKTLT